MTQRQLDKVVDTLYHFNDNEVHLLVSSHLQQQLELSSEDHNLRMMAAALFCSNVLFQDNAALSWEM